MCKREQSANWERIRPKSNCMIDSLHFPHSPSMINGSSCCRWRGATVNAIVLMDRLSTICQTDNPFTLHPSPSLALFFQYLFGFRMRSSVRIMWIRHSSASCLCLCSCLVSLVLIAAEIACRRAIRLSLPKPQAAPFLPYPLSLLLKHAVAGKEHF